MLWNSSRQRNVTYSSTESELNALLDCYLELKWITHLVDKINSSSSNKPAIYIDNKGLDHKIKNLGHIPSLGILTSKLKAYVKISPLLNLISISFPPVK